MPKMVGSWITGATKIANNASAASTGMVRLSYSQARLLPGDAVYASLDTTDSGGPKSYAKRWYRWFASADAILACELSTQKMRGAAGRQGIEIDIDSPCGPRVTYSEGDSVEAVIAACPSGYAPDWSSQVRLTSGRFVAPLVCHLDSH